MADTKIIISAVDQTQAAFDSAKRGLSSLETGASAVRAAMGALGISIAGIGLTSIIKNSLEAADQMGKIAQKVGTTTEALSALKYAADLNNVGFEQLQDGMKKMAKSAFDAATGGQASVQVYTALGISVKDAGGNVKDSTKLLMELADRFSAMPDGVEKTALAMKVFGKSGADMIPLLNGGAQAIQDLMGEAKQLGLVISDDFAQRANTLNDNLKRIEYAGKGAGMAFSEKMIPALSKVADVFLDVSKNERDMTTVTDGLGGALKGLVSIGLGVAHVFSDIGGGLGALAAAAVAAASGDFAQAKKIIELRRADVLQNEADFAARINKLWESTPQAQAIAAKKPNFKADLSEFNQKAAPKSDFESFQKRLLVDLAPQDADGKQTRAAKLQIELGLDKTITAAERERLQLLINQVDVMDAATAAKKSEREGQQVLIGLEKDFQNELEKRRDALNAPLLSASEKALADDMRTVTKRAQDSRIELEKLHVAGSLSAADYDKRLQQVTADEIAQKDAVRGLSSEQDKLNASWQYGADIALRAYLDEVQNVAKSSQAMFTNAFKGMEDALVKFVRTGKLDFKSLADNIINDLIRIQIQQSITAPLAGAMQSSGGLGGLLGSIFGGSQTGMAGFSADQLAGPVMSPAAKGAWFDGGVSAFANGGIVDSPTMFRFGSGGAFRTGLMGEAGPEAVMPLSRGSDGKLGVRTQGGSSNVPPNVVVQVINQSGQAVTAKQQGGPQFDGKDWVLGVVLEAADSNPHFRNAMGMAR